jgi:uncharacterized protein YndB with AHSA1/START domain
MNMLATPDDYGQLIAPATVKMERLLPGPIERVWAYLTESDLRRRWLASGDMKLEPGATFELVWRNDELTDPPGTRPADKSKENRAKGRIIEVDPPHRLVYSWEGVGEVALDLRREGEKVLLTLVHSRLPDRGHVLGVSAGWHAHLDVLAARLNDTKPAPFWDALTRLRAEYERRS